MMSRAEVVGFMVLVGRERISRQRLVGINCHFFASRPGGILLPPLAFCQRSVIAIEEPELSLPSLRVTAHPALELLSGLRSVVRAPS